MHSPPATSISDVFSKVRTSEKNATDRSMFETVMPTASTDWTSDCEEAVSVRATGTHHRTAAAMIVRNALRGKADTRMSGQPFREVIADT